MTDTKNSPTQASWLSPARAQSQQLAEARAQVIKPFSAARARPPRRWLATQPLVWWAAAIALVLLVTSGAWALVFHVAGRRAPSTAAVQERNVPASSVVPSPPPVAPPLPVVAAPAPATKPARKVRPIGKVTPPPSTAVTGTYQEPDGDLILVVPRREQPPLFTPDDFKRRGSPP